MYFKPYQDGYLGTSGRELTVVPLQRWPFRNNPIPDKYSVRNERRWAVDPVLYTPKTADRTSWTNLLTYSEDPSNAAWTKTAVTATASIGTAPNGEGTLGQLVETAANSEHSIAQAATLAAVQSEVSVFAQGGLTREWIRLAFTDSAATVFSAFFNVVRGFVINPSAGTTAAIIPLMNGGYRCVLSFTPAAGAGSFKVNISTDGSTISYAGNTSNGIKLVGMQANAGALSPYVSTTSATRTVSAPERDPSDPFAYLVDEEEPEPFGSAMQILRRTFARIPLVQIVPSFIRINKPGFSGTLPQRVGSYIVAQPDPLFAQFDAYESQTVATDSGSAAGVGGALTGGTYTLTFDGDTTAALAYNASASAVQAALNALGSVADRGGVTVSGDYLSGFVISFAAIASMTASGAGLTLSSGTVSPAYGNPIPVAGFLQGVNFTPTGIGVITGGTFTITLFGQTSAPIAYNATPGAAQSALNALSLTAARGGVTVCPIPSPVLFGPGQISLAFVFSYPAMTANMGSITPAGSTSTTTLLDPYSVNGLTGFYGRQQQITFSGVTVGTRTITTPTPHGITNADTIVVEAGGVFYTLQPGQFNVSATDEIEFDAASGAVATTTDAITAVGKRVRTGYTPGTFNVRCLRTSTFYLPGVTVGIATSADITPPAYQGDPDTMLGLIFSGVGSINYEVGELEQHIGPILSLTVVTIQAADL